jgi:membrane-associated phospholipid phosphatase
MPKPPAPTAKRRLHQVLWQYLRATALFWIPAIGFLVLADNVREHDPLPGDVGILEGLHTIATPALNQFFLLVTTLGSAPFVISGISVAAATLYYLRRRQDALFLLFAAGGTSLINAILKLFFGRDRPDLWQAIVVEQSYSFPSGHAMISLSLALAVGILAWKTSHRWLAISIGALYTVLIGLSRLYLGVHFPSDVVGGWCVSVLWILVLYHIFARYNRRRTLAEVIK